MISNLLYRIKRKLMKLRLQPIRVYCLHHVCEEYDKDYMVDYDWMQIDEFKSKVQSMQQEGIRFISLKEAYTHICNDTYRKKNYAVITFDDGNASLKEILPWMMEHGIPTTLFINGKYLDGNTYRKSEKEKYLTRDELFTMTSPLIEVGAHGWEHTRATDMTDKAFKESVALCTSFLSQHPNYIPFWAYTHGAHTKHSDEVLSQNGLIPVYIEGTANYNDKTQIHRELL